MRFNPKQLRAEFTQRGSQQGFSLLFFGGSRWDLRRVWGLGLRVKGLVFGSGGGFE